MNAQRWILNFLKKIDTIKHSDDTDSDNKDETNLMQSNIIDEKIVSPYHPLKIYKCSKS